MNTSVWGLGGQKLYTAPDQSKRQSQILGKPGRMEVSESRPDAKVPKLVNLAIWGPLGLRLLL